MPSLPLPLSSSLTTPRTPVRLPYVDRQRRSTITARSSRATTPAVASLCTSGQAASVPVVPLGRYARLVTFRSLLTAALACQTLSDCGKAMVWVTTSPFKFFSVKCSTTPILREQPKTPGCESANGAGVERQCMLICKSDTLHSKHPTRWSQNFQMTRTVNV